MSLSTNAHALQRLHAVFIPAVYTRLSLKASQSNPFRSDPHQPILNPKCNCFPLLPETPNWSRTLRE
ncbi:hypothetical protein Y032_0254g288 [Ancylostoma ceylanicum]|uniref:Uncharacterized protein n=1 Tax=Ancylostoma ceylanicum TaxID=53326 RepID=A0A016SCD6_9BILA|nr:hypothetical protein Y032_0254g288 [Ancylostoma ceylanicum]